MAKNNFFNTRDDEKEDEWQWPVYNITDQTGQDRIKEEINNLLRWLCSGGECEAVCSQCLFGYGLKELLLQIKERRWNLK